MLPVSLDSGEPPESKGTGTISSGGPQVHAGVDEWRESVGGGGGGAGRSDNYKIRDLVFELPPGPTLSTAQQLAPDLPAAALYVVTVALLRTAAEWRLGRILWQVWGWGCGE